MNFRFSNILCDYTKYRMSFLEKEVCNYIPDIRKLGITDITEEEFYELIGFSDEEIKLFGKNTIKDNSTEDLVQNQDNNQTEEQKNTLDVL